MGLHISSKHPVAVFETSTAPDHNDIHSGVANHQAWSDRHEHADPDDIHSGVANHDAWSDRDEHV